MKVNLLLIGAGRSGTTALYKHLKSHTNICFSNIKEVPFFSVKEIYTRGISYYHSFFQHDKQKITASSDTYLLIDTEAPQRILDYNPEMKIIILLREPVERSYSSYIYGINNGHENKKTSFRETFINEKEKIANANIITRNNLGHFYSGLYHKHIAFWMQFFPKENFLLVKSSDLKNDLKQTLKEVCKFLHIPDIENSIEIKSNKAASVKFMFLHRFLIDRNNKFRKKLSKITPNSLKRIIFNSGIIERIKSLNKEQSIYTQISDEDKNFVMNYFKEDLRKLKNDFNISF